MKKPKLINIHKCTSLECENCQKICNSEYEYKNKQIIACSEKCCREYCNDKNKKLFKVSEDKLKDFYSFKSKINKNGLEDLDLSDFGILDNEDLKEKLKYFNLSNYKLVKLLFLKDEEILRIINSKPRIPTEEEYKQFGVHIAHCCLQHFCKYGDEDCPVSNGILKQEYPCESCEEEFY